MNYLKKYNLDGFKSTGTSPPQKTSGEIKNYFLKDNKKNKLLIFQLKPNTSLRYSDLEKHFGISLSSVSEASQSVIEDIIGVKEEGLWTTSTHQPRISKVKVYKDKSLMGHKPKDFETFSSMNPWKTKPHDQMIELLGNPNVK